MDQVWINPAVLAGGSTRVGPALDTARIHVASEFAPVSSPAPAGNPIVPTGWIRQMGSDGETDVSLADTRNPGPTQYDATMTPITVPINSGGWPPLPGIPLNP